MNIDCLLGVIGHESCGVSLTGAGIVEVHILAVDDIASFVANVAKTALTDFKLPALKKAKKISITRNGATFTDPNTIIDNAGTVTTENLLLPLTDGASLSVREFRAWVTECGDCNDYAFVLTNSDGRDWYWGKDPIVAIDPPIMGAAKVVYDGQDNATRGTVATGAQFDMKFKREISGSKFVAIQIASSVPRTDYI